MDAKELAGQIISRLRERSLSGSWTVLEVGYGTAEDVVTQFISSALSARAAEVERLREACKGMLADLDSFEGPEKWINGDFPHYCPAGRMVDMKHIALIRALLFPPDAPEPTP